jgi:hypothetical protein
MRHFAKLWQHETSPNIRVNSHDSRAEKIFGGQSTARPTFSKHQTRNVVTTNYTDFTDEKHQFFTIRAMRVIRGS